MDRGTVVPELQRVIGVEGLALLDLLKLLKPLVEQMVSSQAIAHVVVFEEQLDQARLGLLQQVGMRLTAKIKLRKVSYLQLLLGEFQDKAVSLQRL